MKESLMLALLAALSSGMGMAALGAINSASGKLVGPLGTGLLVNILAGLLAAITLLLIKSRLPDINLGTVQTAAPLIITSAILGLGTITGIAYSLGRIGVAAGIATILLGQMALAVVIDALGWNATGRIPMGFGRLAGLVLLAIATWFLLPPPPRP
jgi:bacterial/archaeal transporter family-2 protein